MYDGTIRLYNNLTAMEISQLAHLPKIDMKARTAKNLFVYQEETSTGLGNSVSGAQTYQFVCY